MGRTTATRNVWMESWVGTATRECMESWVGERLSLEMYGELKCRSVVR